MAYRKNVKRIDPRYFLNETANRNDDGSSLEEDYDAAAAAERDRLAGDRRIKKFGAGRPPPPGDTSPEALSYWALKVLVARTGISNWPGQTQDAYLVKHDFPKGIKTPKGEALEDLDNDQLADLASADGGGIGPGQRKAMNREAAMLAASGFLPSGKEMSKE